MTISTESLLEVGVVVGTHGLRGDLKIRPLPTGALALPGATQVFLMDSKGHLAPHVAVRSSQHKQHILLRLVGLESLEAVQGLIGQTVWMHHDVLPETNSDQHYWHQLEGLEVIDREAGFLGHVVGMFATPAHEILEVRGGRGEVLIPAIPEFIVQVDLDTGQLQVDLPEGLVPQVDAEQ